MGGKFKCYCNKWNCPENFCYTDTICYAHFKDTQKGHPPYIPEYGCDDDGFNPKIHCDQGREPQQFGTTIHFCCGGKPFCNVDVDDPPDRYLKMNATEGLRVRSIIEADGLNLTGYPKLPYPAEDSVDLGLQSILSFPSILLIVVPTVLLLLLLMLLFLLRVQHKKISQKLLHHLPLAVTREPQLSPTPGFPPQHFPPPHLTDTSHDPLLSSSRLPDPFSNGSHAQGCYLARRTIANDVQKLCAIGTGRYGQVYRGVYMGSNVAIKIFPAKEEQSWANEVNVYKQLRHKNILHYYAADRFDDSVMTELWLVVDYHKQGSLFEFLRNAGPLESDLIALNMMYSIADGLTYLHQLIRGHPSPDVKQEMGHCDIKSRNILVKDDLTCCIADFGLAITNHFSPCISGQQSIRPAQLVGTRRYNPPDVVGMLMARERGDHIPPLAFETCKQADIYCTALVFWEISRRVKPWGVFDNELPFYEYFPSHEPTIEEMHDVVCKQNLRPKFSSLLCASVEAGARRREMEKICVECMNGRASARLPALLIKKRISKLLSTGPPPLSASYLIDSLA